MTEVPFYFSASGNQLFGVLHAPLGVRSRLAFLLCHPFAEEKLWSHRVFVSLARTLALRGHCVLRFDFAAAGDSSGLSASTDMNTYAGDVESALRELLRRCPDVEQTGIIGLRLGATVAALVAEGSECHGTQQRGRMGPLILLEPIVNGDAYLQELLRINLATQLAVQGSIKLDRDALLERLRTGASVNVDGYELGTSMFETLSHKPLLLDGPRHYAEPVLVVQIASSQQTAIRPELQTLAASYPQGHFCSAVEQPFWREIRPFYGRASNLEASALSWMEELHA